MPYEYKHIPMTHHFLQGLDTQIKTQSGSSLAPDIRPYDEEKVIRILQAHEDVLLVLDFDLALLKGKLLSDLRNAQQLVNRFKDYLSLMRTVLKNLGIEVAESEVPNPKELGTNRKLQKALVWFEAAQEFLKNMYRKRGEEGEEEKCRLADFIRPHWRFAEGDELALSSPEYLKIVSDLDPVELKGKNRDQVERLALETFKQSLQQMSATLAALEIKIPEPKVDYLERPDLLRQAIEWFEAAEKLQRKEFYTYYTGCNLEPLQTALKGLEECTLEQRKAKLLAAQRLLKTAQPKNEKSEESSLPDHAKETQKALAWVDAELQAVEKSLQRKPSQLCLSLAQSKTLYAFAISEQGRLSHFGSTQGVIRSFSRWLEQAFSIHLFENQQGNENLLSENQRVNNFLEAKAWSSSDAPQELHWVEDQGASAVVKVVSTQKLVLVGKEKPHINMARTRRVEEQKQKAGKKAAIAARADVEQNLDSRYKFSLRPEMLKVSLEQSFWKNHILPRAWKKLNELPNSEFTAETLYALVPCLCDAKFRKAFCEKLTTRPQAEFASAMLWIGQCYSGYQEELDEIRSTLMNVNDLKAKIRENPGSLWPAMKTCTVRQYNDIVKNLREDKELKPDDWQLAYSSIPLYARAYHAWQNLHLANPLSSFGSNILKLIKRLKDCCSRRNDPRRLPGRDTAGIATVMGINSSGLKVDDSGSRRPGTETSGVSLTPMNSEASFAVGMSAAKTLTKSDQNQAQHSELGTADHSTSKQASKRAFVS